MADVTINLETDNTEELTNQGIKAFHLGDYTTSVTALSKAVELLADKFGDKHDSLGVAYFYYGKALLELYRAEVEPLGDAVPREIGSDSEESANNETAQENGSNETVPEPKDAENDDKLPEEGEADDKKNEEEEEEPTDLQVAWEVLELAKMIFDKRGESGKKELAETLILLGEVSLESDNFANAIDDIKSGLEIQKYLVGDYSRTLAQTHYKLGMALSTNNQVDEAIKSFITSLEILKRKAVELSGNAEENKEEIDDIVGLIPEIEEKIADMKNFKEETANQLVATLQSKPETNSSFDAGSSSAPANNISHLIKRKRKEDEDTEEENPSKRPSE